MKKMGQLIGSLNTIKMLVFYGCRNVPRDSGEVYLVNQEDKIALCRESVLILGSDGVERDISGDLDDKVHDYLLSKLL